MITSSHISQPLKTFGSLESRKSEHINQRGKALSQALGHEGQKWQPPMEPGNAATPSPWPVHPLEYEGSGGPFTNELNSFLVKESLGSLKFPHE